MLRGRVIVVTGASSGIGEATALALAKHHVKMVIAARREERLEKLAGKIRSAGSQALVVTTDLTDNSQIKKLVEKTVSTFGRIDVLCNIAGWGVYKWFEDYSFEEVENQFHVNVLGLAELCRLTIPIMKRQRSGHIINMSSYASKIVFPPLAVYSSTKYAVEGLSDGLRRELKPWGILVSRVHPSAVSGTEFNAKSDQRGGVHYQASDIGRISREYVANRIVKLIEHPKPALFLGRLYDFPVMLNIFLPGLIDLIASIWVRNHRTEVL